MTTASTVLDNVRMRFGDTAGNFISDTGNGLVWVDKAQAKLVVQLQPLTRLTGFTVSANQEAFTLPADYQLVEVVWHTKAVRTVLKYKAPVEFFRLKMVAQSATGYPVYFTIFEKRVYVWPMYASAGQTASASGISSAAAVSVSIATTTGFQTQGMVSTASGELIQYTNTSTGALNGCLRGYGGTTAASISSGDTITQCDLQMLYRREAASLSAATNSLDLPTMYQKCLEDYVLYLAYMAEGSGDKAQVAYQIYEQELKTVTFQAQREQMATPMRIIDRL